MSFICMKGITVLSTNVFSGNRSKSQGDAAIDLNTALNSKSEVNK